MMKGKLRFWVVGLVALAAIINYIDRGALGVALTTGDLTREAKIAPGVERQRGIEQSRAVDEGVAVDRAESVEASLRQAGNHPQDLLLDPPAHPGLEAHRLE